MLLRSYCKISDSLLHKILQTYCVYKNIVCKVITQPLNYKTYYQVDTKSIGNPIIYLFQTCQLVIISPIAQNLAQNYYRIYCSVINMFKTLNSKLLQSLVKKNIRLLYDKTEYKIMTEPKQNLSFLHTYSKTMFYSLQKQIA